jgi:AcrR family transcriptional regulator
MMRFEGQTERSVGRQEVLKVTQQEDGRSRIMTAALEAFSTSGFEGSSLRRIADMAGVQHQLVVYHFKTKDALWRAVVASFFDQDDARLRLWLKNLEAAGPAAALRAAVRAFVRFTAQRPEFHRIATFEGRSDNERLRWLLKTYMRPYYKISTNLIREGQAAGVARPGDPGQLHYAMIGLVTTSFVFAPEYRLMTGIEPFAENEIEKTANLVCDFLMLPGSKVRAARGKAKRRAGSGNNAIPG